MKLGKLLLSMAIFSILFTGKSFAVEYPIKTVAYGQYGSLLTSRNYVVRYQHTWNQLWHDLHFDGDMDPVPEVPKVDFQKEMIIAVAKNHSSGGLKIKVSKVQETQRHILATVQHFYASGEVPVTDAETQNYYILKTKRSFKPVVFPMEVYEVLDPEKWDAIW